MKTMHRRKDLYTALTITVLSGLLLCGCRTKVTDAKVRSLPIGTPIDQVFAKLGQPKARGREVTLESEAKVVKEYPKDLEVCLWKGESTYLLTFHRNILVEKERFNPSWTDVSVRKLNADRMREGDEIVVRYLKKGVLYGPVGP
jgi:hypothetical protein